METTTDVEPTFRLQPDYIEGKPVEDVAFWSIRGGIENFRGKIRVLRRSHSPDEGLAQHSIHMHDIYSGERQRINVPPDLGLNDAFVEWLNDQLRKFVSSILTR